MAEIPSDYEAEERMKRAEKLLAERLARPEDADDPLGGLKGQLQTGSDLPLLAIAGISAVAGLLIVWQAEPIARAIQQFIAGADAADSPVIVYTIIGWVLVGAAVVCVVLNYLGKPIDFQIREKGIRYSEGSRHLELRWDEVRDVTIKETEHIHAKYGSQYRDREITIEANGNTIVIPGIMEESFPIADVLSAHWELVGGGDAGGADEASPRHPSSRKKRKKSGGMDLPRAVAQKLASGVPAKDVMTWLQEKHGLPRPAAEAVLAKALGQDA